MPAEKPTVVVDVQPASIDLCFTRRDSPLFQFNLTDENGSPLDLTGTSFSLEVNEAPDGSGSAVFVLSPTNTLDNTGVVQFQPTALQMTHAEGESFYDLQWTNGTVVRTVAAGTWIWGPDITD